MKTKSPLHRPLRPNPGLITAVQESASDLIEHQMIRDRQRFKFEKQKLVLLLTLILSLWLMFALLWEKLDDLRPAGAAPTLESAPPSLDSENPNPEPHYVL